VELQILDAAFKPGLATMINILFNTVSDMPVYLHIAAGVLL
jgi:hypothetical protein